MPLSINAASLAITALPLTTYAARLPTMVYTTVPCCNRNDQRCRATITTYVTTLIDHCYTGDNQYSTIMIYAASLTINVIALTTYAEPVTIIDQSLTFQTHTHTHPPTHTHTHTHTVTCVTFLSPSNSCWQFRARSLCPIVIRYYYDRSHWRNAISLSTVRKSFPDF